MMVSLDKQKHLHDLIASVKSWSSSRVTPETQYSKPCAWVYQGPVVIVYYSRIIGDGSRCTVEGVESVSRYGV